MVADHNVKVFVNTVVYGHFDKAGREDSRTLFIRRKTEVHKIGLLTGGGKRMHAVGRIADNSLSAIVVQIEDNIEVECTVLTEIDKLGIASVGIQKLPCAVKHF